MNSEVPLRSSKTISTNDAEKCVMVQGWAQEIRNLGGISFLILRDRYGLVQITAPKKKITPEVMEVLTTVPRESVVSIKGTVAISKQAKSGVEIIPSSIEILSKATSPLPMGVIDKVNVEADTRFDNRFMDLRRPETRAVFEIKSLCLHLIDQYLIDNAFTEVFTPKIVVEGAEGGSTLFELKYFDRQAFLAQSPQLYKQMLMSTGLDRIFEIGPAFRAEPSDTVRHVSEFISFDGEMAFIRVSEGRHGHDRGLHTVRDQRYHGPSDPSVRGPQYRCSVAKGALSYDRVQRGHRDGKCRRYGPNSGRGPRDRG